MHGALAELADYPAKTGSHNVGSNDYVLVIASYWMTSVAWSSTW
jgi:hypothetical protein